MFDFSFILAVPSGLMSYTHVFFVTLQFKHRPGAACSHDHYDVLYSSRSILYGAMHSFGHSKSSFSPFVAKIGVARETTDTISINNHENEPQSHRSCARSYAIIVVR